MWERCLLPVLGGLVLALIIGIWKCIVSWNRHSFVLDIWAWWIWNRNFTWGFGLWGFGKRQRTMRRSAKIVCLEEYVKELTLAREKLVDYAIRMGTNHCEIFIKIYTMQLPSDWPLWFQDADNIKALDATPLGRYILGFAEFISGKERFSGIKINLKRYIVIDNIDESGSPNKIGDGRLMQLAKDVQSKWYNLYREVLHGPTAEPFLIKYNKPWPEWLSDSVFFGIRLTDGDSLPPPKWLWGFTTSYNPGEDFLLYRHIRLHKPGLIPVYLPDGVHSILEMAERDLWPGAEPLSRFRMEKPENGDQGGTIPGEFMGTDVQVDLTRLSDQHTHRECKDIKG